MFAEIQLIESRLVVGSSSLILLESFPILNLLSCLLSYELFPSVENLC